MNNLDMLSKLWFYLLWSQVPRTHKDCAIAIALVIVMMSDRTD